MNNSLLPCLNCRTSPKGWEGNSSTNRECPNCGRNSGEYCSHEEADASWNLMNAAQGQAMQGVGEQIRLREAAKEAYACLGRDYWPDKHGTWQRLGEALGILPVMIDTPVKSIAAHDENTDNYSPVPEPRQTELKGKLRRAAQTSIATQQNREAVVTPNELKELGIGDRRKEPRE